MITDRAEKYEDLTLGRWRLGGCLGRGGMSVVYEATNTTTGRKAAVKILHFSENVPEEVADRFFHELHISRRLKHQNIIDVYEFGFEQEVGFFLVMELLQGCPLFDYMKSVGGELPFSDVCEIVSQICDAMAFAHQKDIVHRDLKPENLFLCGGPNAIDKLKVLDFGIARFQLGESSRLTQSGTTLGTPHYLSPEQARGEVVSLSSDIYSLSVILFELLTGKQLFTADSPLEYMMRHACAEPPTLSMVRPDKSFPAALEKLIAQGLAKTPEDRISSMVQFKEQLCDCMIEGVAVDIAIPRKNLEEKGEDRDDVVAQILPMNDLSTYQKEMTPSKIDSLRKEASGRKETISAPKILSSKTSVKPVKAATAPLSKKARKRSSSNQTSLWKNPLFFGAFILLVFGVGGAALFRTLRNKHDISAVEVNQTKRAWKQFGELPHGKIQLSKKAKKAVQIKQKRKYGKSEPDLRSSERVNLGTDAGSTKHKRWLQLIQQKLRAKRLREGVPDSLAHERVLKGKDTKTVFRRSAPPIRK